jgi:predicted RNase H-like nuclease (RuvC/YqgF family)
VSIRLSSQKYAERVALSVILHFIGEPAVAGSHSDTERLRTALRKLQQENESAEAELSKLESEIAELKRSLMTTESERAGLHFQSFSLFNENTSLAIRVCGTDFLRTARESQPEAYSTLDTILNRYVFKENSI